MATIALGTFTVTGPIQRTYIQLRGGDVVRVRATGEVNFGGGLLGILAPVLPPDGDNHPTPSHYPAPRLRKNSLILGVHLHGGGTVWHQGGRTASFTVGNVGPMHARFWFGANDATPDDNSGGWAVSIEIERPDSLSSSAIQLRVARIELVQSIQRIDNSVPLVAGKQTLVRVFVDSGRQAGSPRVGPLGGSLSVRWPDGRTDTASALNPPGGPTATVGHDRNALDDSVNFVLPINTTPGEASVRVRTWVTGRADLPGSSAVGELTARFVPGPSLAILPLLISVPSRSLPAPSEAQARRVLGAVEQRLPYAAGQFRVLPPVRVTWQVPAGGSFDWTLLLYTVGAALSLPTAGDPVRIGFIAMPPGDRTAGIAMYRPFILHRSAITTIGNGFDFDAESCAHELGHALGLNHAQCNDPPVPWSAFLPAAIEEPAWNPLADRGPQMISTGSPEMMTYCGPRWPSIRSWQYVLNGRHV